MVITATVRRSKEQAAFAASAINHCIGRGPAAFVLRNPTGRLALLQIPSDSQSGLAEQAESGLPCPLPALGAKVGREFQRNHATGGIVIISEEPDIRRKPCYLGRRRTGEIHLESLARLCCVNWNSNEALRGSEVDQ